MQAYHQSASTLNLLRAFTKGGFADLARVHQWNQDFVRASSEGHRYEAIANEIERALRFMSACGLTDGPQPRLHEVDFFTSHEALILGYEEALTRRDSLTGEYYDTSAHMVWIGERTRQLDGAHVEFCAGIRNPIGVKLGPDVTPAEVVALCDRLDPEFEAGRLTLISRMGAKRVATALPPLLEAVEATGHRVVWACDPMHGNTFTTEDGHKTRRFDDIEAEIAGFFATHKSVGTWPGGMHVELTGDAVTECLGGADDISAARVARTLRDHVRSAPERSPIPGSRVQGRRTPPLIRSRGRRAAVQHSIDGEPEPRFGVYRDVIWDFGHSFSCR